MRTTAGRLTHAGEDLFHEMANGLPLIVWVHDAAGDQVMVNDTFCEFFGVSREEMKGGRWQMLMHSEDADQYTREFLSCVQARRPFHAEVRVRRADGEWRWLESWARPRFSESGEFHGMVGTSADVTERKRADEALARANRQIEEQHAQLLESEERLRLAMESTGLGTYDFDVGSRVSTWSDQLKRLIGVERPGKVDPVEELEPRLHPEDRDRFLDQVNASLDRATTERHALEFRLLREDGSIRWLRDTGKVFFSEVDGRPRPVRVVGTVVDVTEQREAEARLRESDRRKDEYLAMLGHELRNPLAAIQSATELVKMTTSQDPRLDRAAGVLARQSEHMARLIDGLLEVSRIARGKIAVESEVLDWNNLCEQILDDRMAPILERGLELERELSSRPVWVSGDRIRLAQILDNLLGNALKFTPSGRIVISLDTDRDTAVLRVRDTGIGIRSDRLEQIFVPFHQEAPDSSRAGGGLGLGLALTRGLVELHAGTIEAHSRGLGFGTEIVVRLPLVGAPHQPMERQNESFPSRACSILIVEDNVDAAQMLSELLQQQGHDVSVAPTGQQGLELLRRQGHEVVLCDIGMPGMSGYDFAKIVRTDPSLGSPVLVAVTGYGQPEDRKRTAKAGFDEHLVKPITLTTLEEVLQSLSTDGRSEGDRPDA